MDSLDTLAAARTLEEAGIARKQAEAIASLHRPDRAGLAGVKTEMAGLKTEVAGVKARLDRVENEMAGVKARLGRIETEMAEFRAEMKAELRWMKVIGGVIIALVALPVLRELFGPG
ncbi:MAG: hypothetical protein GDA53_05310 [Rhodobacteraceae bacterium]|nr:hypothetical protein [Paracoccaceae bacterium]